ncbi:unnamed protein product, partial [Prorocentrum cordatum]
ELWLMAAAPSAPAHAHAGGGGHAGHGLRAAMDHQQDNVPVAAVVLLAHVAPGAVFRQGTDYAARGISESLRVHVMSFEFPGYGLHVGAASQRAIDDAADAILNFIVRDLQIDIAQVVWYGRSIGSGPTVAICHRITKDLGRNPGGCILQCGYANFPEAQRSAAGMEVVACIGRRIARRHLRR